MSTLDAPLAIDPALQGRDTSSPKQTRFHAPTSSDFSLGIARSSLRSMGITANDDMDEAVLGQDVGHVGSANGGRGAHPSKDPIWSLSKVEALRLCRVYDEEMGLIYPILDIDQIVRHAGLLFTFVDAAARNMLIKTLEGSDSIQDADTDMLKIVLALALVTEDPGGKELARRLVQSVRRTAENRLLGNVGIKDVQILTLMVRNV